LSLKKLLRKKMLMKNSPSLKTTKLWWQIPPEVRAKMSLLRFVSGRKLIELRQRKEEIKWEHKKLDQEEMRVDEEITRLEEELRFDDEKEEKQEEEEEHMEEDRFLPEEEELPPHAVKEEEYMEEDWFPPKEGFHWNENSAETQAAMRIINRGPGIPCWLPPCNSILGPKRAPRGLREVEEKLVEEEVAVEEPEEEELVEAKDSGQDGVSEEPVVEEEEDVARMFAQQWMQLDGDADDGFVRIPKHFTPCKYFFKAKHGCKNKMCQFSHDAEIFCEEPYASFLQNFGWEKKGMKTFTPQDYEKWEERKRPWKRQRQEE